MGKIINNRPLFKNSRLLFFYFFLETFVGDKAVMEGDKVVIGECPVSPQGKTMECANFPRYPVSSTLVSEVLRGLFLFLSESFALEKQELVSEVVRLKKQVERQDLDTSRREVHFQEIRKEADQGLTALQDAENRINLLKSQVCFMYPVFPVKDHLS